MGFCNHKIPKECQGKIIEFDAEIFVDTGQYSFTHGLAKEWEYCSSGIKSKTGRYKMNIKGEHKYHTLYLKKTEFIIVPLKLGRTVKKDMRPDTTDNRG